MVKEEHDPSALHPGTREKGWEGLGLVGDTAEEILEAAKEKQRELWAVWIMGERDGKPAAYLYRPKDCKAAWSDGYARIGYEQGAISFSPSGDVKPPDDWAKPVWASASRVHDWKNHVPSEIRGLWFSFTFSQKMALARWAASLADREEWE